MRQVEAVLFVRIVMDMDDDLSVGKSDCKGDRGRLRMGLRRVCLFKKPS